MKSADALLAAVLTNAVMKTLREQECEIENLKSQMEQMKKDLNLLMAERKAHLEWLDASDD